MATDLALDIWLRAHDEMSDIFKKVGQQAEGLRGKLGLLAGGFGVLAGGVIAESVKQAADFESTTQALANNTNMGAAGLAAMRQNALALQAATGQGWERIAEGYMHIANHAYSGAAATNILTAATKNAAATNGDAAEDANALAGILREYNVQAKDLASNTALATRYMDVLHNAVAQSNYTMKEFTEGSKRAFAVAGAAGVPISQVTAQLAVLSEHGFPHARNAALNWAGMLRSLEAPHAAAIKGMQYLSHVTGVDLVGDINRLRKDGAYLPQFLDDIRKATKGGDISLLQKIMPQSSYAAVLQALVRNHEELQKAQRVTDAAQAGRRVPGMVGTNEAFAAQQKTLQGQLRDLHGTLTSTMNTIGTAFIPVLDKLLHAITPIIARVSEWVSHHQKLTGIILGATAVLGPFVGAIMIIGPAMAAAREAATVWTAAQWLLNAALDANPIGLAIIAIAGLAAAGIFVATHWKQISAMLQQVWSGIADAAGDLWTWLTGIWNGIIGDAQLLWENLGEWLSGIWQGISSFATSIWTNVVAFFKGLWDVVSGAWQGFWNGLGATVQTIWNGISGAAQTVWNTAVAVVTAVWDTISGAWTGAWDTIKTAAGIAWGKVSDAAKGAWDTAITAVGAIWGTISGTWSTAWDTIKTDAQKAWTKVGDAAKGAWDTAIDTVKKIWDTVSGAWTATWTTVKTEVHKKWDDITGAVGKAWNGAKHTIMTLWDKVKGAWDKAWSNIGKVFSAFDFSKGTPKMWTDARATVETLWDKVKGLWTTAWNKIHDTLQTAWNGIKALPGKLLDPVVEPLKKLWDGIKGAWESKWNDIKKVLDIGTWFKTNVIDKALHWGEDMVHNLIKGIGNMKDALYRKVVEILGPVARLLESHSPPVEGPLAFMPDFTYIADALHMAIPQVRAASRDLASAAVIGGGTFALGTSSAGLPGGPSGRGVATSPSLAAAGGGAGGVTINVDVHANGAMFNDRQGIRDLAHQVSEEIMHKVRLQGGLLTQI